MATVTVSLVSMDSVPHAVLPLHDKPVEDTTVASSKESTIDLSRYIVTEFFRKTEIPIQDWHLDLDGPVGARIRAAVQSWDLGDIPAPRVQRHTVTAISMATTTFGHTHADTQVHVGLFTVLCLCVDDLEVDGAALAAFVPRLQGGAPQLHPVLDLLVANLQRMPAFYHAYAASAIVAGTVHFINCTLFDKQEVNMELHPTALPYVLYKRARNSLGEVYASFVWDKANFPDIATHIQVMPETMIYLDYSNDILSFYKEEIAGETNNFVHDRVRVTGKNTKAVLLDILDEAVNAVVRARMILKGGKEKETWERFLAGYVAFHFTSPRYQLATLTAQA